MHIEELKIDGYEKVVRCEDKATGLKAIIAVHNTNLGPAVGGTRLFPYASEEAALTDVLRLSRGMTYKSSLAGIDFGGGKSVIIADPKDKTPEMLKAFGRFVNTLGGIYICAEDVNTSPADMEIVYTETRHVAGLNKDGGDPSPFTALGVVESIKATATKLDIPMSKLSVAIQGVGHVGWYMTEMLRGMGTTVYITDLRTNLVDELVSKTGAIAVKPEDIMTLECDILAPCAMGATLNDQSIPALKCKAIVGCANNQLAEMRHAKMLQERGILYGPDYLVNAGGIINVFFERKPQGYVQADAEQACRDIAKTLTRIFDKAEAESMTTAEAADRLAEQRFLAHRVQMVG
ncbi:MAG: amino acid dehydrogenase [Proteobacteria bacterium]|nr:amino acid dehydrogenase [Pseudomonadota bacterium]